MKGNFDALSAVSKMYLLPTLVLVSISSKSTSSAFHGSTARTGRRISCWSLLLFRPSKPVDVLVLLSQGGNAGKRVEGVVQDSFRTLHAQFFTIASDTPVLPGWVLKEGGGLWPWCPPASRMESKSVVYDFCFSRKNILQREGSVLPRDIVE